MRVGVLGGTGPAGQGLSARLASVGVETIIGSRSSQRAEETAESIRKAWPDLHLPLTGGDNEAAASADLVVIATSWEAAVETAASHSKLLEAKVVICIANALIKVGREFHALIPPRGSVAAGVQAVLPHSMVAGAFQHIPAKELGELAKPVEADVLVVSDYPEANAATCELVDRIPSMRSRSAGGLASAGAIEAMTAVLLTMNLRYKTRTAIRIVGIKD